jgi:hypothetical protein
MMMCRLQKSLVMSRNHLALEGQQLVAGETSVLSCTVAIPCSARQETDSDGIQFSSIRPLSDGAPKTAANRLEAPSHLNSTSPPESMEQWANASDLTLVESVKGGNHSAYSELFKTDGRKNSNH